MTIPGTDIPQQEQDTREPAWLELLKEARRNLGGMSYYAIAERAGLSHGTVFNTFRGRNVPVPNTMHKLTAALTREGGPEFNTIMAEYEQATGVAFATVADDGDTYPPRDSKLKANAPEYRSHQSQSQYISANKALQMAFETMGTDIADAIRDVAAAIREQKT